MKKFVTLSAIALAGATLGVGSAFGWWADDTENAPKATEESNSRVVEVKEVAPPVDKAEIRSVEGLIKANQGLVEIELGDPDRLDGKKPEAVRALSRVVPDNVSEIGKLADQLEQEAKQLDDQGQKEAAGMQRKIVQRLRETIKKSVGSRDVLFWRKSADPRVHIEFKDEPIPVYERRVRRAEVVEQAKRAEQQATRQHLEAKINALKAELQQLDPDMQARIAALKETELRSLKDMKDRETKTQVYEFAYQDAAKAGHLDHVRRTLREAADRLEKVGKMDEARALREHAEHVMRALQQPKVDEVRDAARQEVEIRVRGDGKGRFTEIRDDKPEVRSREGKVEGQHHIAIVGVGDGHLADLHKQLHELRHEIGELRADIRKLHKQLKSDRREKEEEDDHKDEDEDHGEKPSAEKKVSGKSSAAKDYLKVYTGIINEAGAAKALDLGIELKKADPDTKEKAAPQP